MAKTSHVNRLGVRVLSNVLGLLRLLINIRMFIYSSLSRTPVIGFPVGHKETNSLKKCVVLFWPVIWKINFPRQSARMREIFRLNRFFKWFRRFSKRSILYILLFLPELNKQVQWTLPIPMGTGAVFPRIIAVPRLIASLEINNPPPPSPLTEIFKITAFLNYSKPSRVSSRKKFKNLRTRAVFN